MEPKGFMGLVHVNWVVLGMTNTPPIAQTQIIELDVCKLPQMGIVFFLNFDIAMQYPSRFQ
jgi:hypothetical protein